MNFLAQQKKRKGGGGGKVVAMLEWGGGTHSFGVIQRRNDASFLQLHLFLTCSHVPMPFCIL